MGRSPYETNTVLCIYDRASSCIHIVMGRCPYGGVLVFTGGCLLSLRGACFRSRAQGVTRCIPFWIAFFTQFLLDFGVDFRSILESMLRNRRFGRSTSFYIGFWVSGNDF